MPVQPLQRRADIEPILRRDEPHEGLGLLGTGGAATRMPQELHGRET